MQVRAKEERAERLRREKESSAEKVENTKQIQKRQIQIQKDKERLRREKKSSIEKVENATLTLKIYLEKKRFHKTVEGFEIYER